MVREAPRKRSADPHKCLLICARLFKRGDGLKRARRITTASAHSLIATQAEVFTRPWGFCTYQVPKPRIQQTLLQAYNLNISNGYPTQATGQTSMRTQFLLIYENSKPVQKAVGTTNVVIDARKQTNGGIDVSRALGKPTPFHLLVAP